MLETLIDGQDHQLARATEPPVIKNARKIGQHTEVLAPVPAEDFTCFISHRKIAFLYLQDPLERQTAGGIEKVGMMHVKDQF